ncbi:hypothetical protein HC928_16530 [bacterium]|nr:hypothetical protein [bacterium]
MSLQDIKRQAMELSPSDRLELASAILRSLQDATSAEPWQFLVSRPHPWRKQLYIKGRKLLASTLWQDAIANHMTPEQAAENWDLPLGAVREAIEYCETHQDLLRLEAEEECDRLQGKGVSLEPNVAT